MLASPEIWLCPVLCTVFAGESIYAETLIARYCEKVDSGQKQPQPASSSTCIARLTTTLVSHSLLSQPFWPSIILAGFAVSPSNSDVRCDPILQTNHVKNRVQYYQHCARYKSRPIGKQLHITHPVLLLVPPTLPSPHIHPSNSLSVHPHNLPANPASRPIFVPGFVSTPTGS
jgi:hypothetical protein